MIAHEFGHIIASILEFKIDARQNPLICTSMHEGAFADSIATALGLGHQLLKALDKMGEQNPNMKGFC